MTAIFKRTVQIGESLHVFAGTPADAEAIGLKIGELVETSLAKGETIRFTETGIQMWIEVTPLFDTSKQGSERYTWHSDGNRVKCARYVVTKSKEGKTNRKALTPVWRKYDNL